MKNLFNSINNGVSCAIRKRKKIVISFVNAFIAFSILATSTASYAQLPSGGNIAAGTGSINTSGNTMDVNITGGYNGGNNSLITWNDFSIANGNTVNFNNGAHNVMNVVTGSNISNINGQLNGSGSGAIYLLNKNGIVVGSQGQVITNGNFIAATHDVQAGFNLTVTEKGGNNVIVTNDTIASNFLNGNNIEFVFGDNQGSPTTGVIKNLGNITSQNGNVELYSGGSLDENSVDAPSITNNGNITANNGSVHMGSGNAVLLKVTSTNPDDRFYVSAAGTYSSIENNGNIEAINANLNVARSNPALLAINNTGTIRATAINSDGGRIRLTSDHGNISNSGLIELDNSVGVNENPYQNSQYNIDNYDSTKNNIVMKTSGGIKNLGAGKIRATNANVDIRTVGTTTGLGGPNNGGLVSLSNSNGENIIDTNNTGFVSIHSGTRITVDGVIQSGENYGTYLLANKSIIGTQASLISGGDLWLIAGNSIYSTEGNGLLNISTNDLTSLAGFGDESIMLSDFSNELGIHLDYIISDYTVSSNDYLLNLNATTLSGSETKIRMLANYNGGADGGVNYVHSGGDVVLTVADENFRIGSNLAYGSYDGDYNITVNGGDLTIAVGEENEVLTLGYQTSGDSDLGTLEPVNADINLTADNVNIYSSVKAGLTYYSVSPWNASDVNIIAMEDVNIDLQNYSLDRFPMIFSYGGNINIVADEANPLSAGNGGVYITSPSFVGGFSGITSIYSATPLQNNIQANFYQSYDSGTGEITYSQLNVGTLYEDNNFEKYDTFFSDSVVEATPSQNFVAYYKTSAPVVPSAINPPSRSSTGNSNQVAQAQQVSSNTSCNSLNDPSCESSNPGLQDSYKEYKIKYASLETAEKSSEKKLASGSSYETVSGEAFTVKGMADYVDNKMYTDEKLAIEVPLKILSLPFEVLGDLSGANKGN
jgi:filamentous hemagglutinin family protein